MRKTCGLDMYKDSTFVSLSSDSGRKIQQESGVLTPSSDSLHNLPVFHDVGEVAMRKTHRLVMLNHNMYIVYIIYILYLCIKTKDYGNSSVREEKKEY